MLRVVGLSGGRMFMLRLTMMALALAGLSACGGKKDQTATIVTESGGDGHAQKATIVADGQHEKVTIKSDDGKSTLDIGGNSAAEVAKLAPLYPGAKVVSSMIGQSAEGAGGMATLSTTASKEAVIAFYKRVVAERGLKQVSEVTTNGNYVLVAGNEGGEGGMQIMVQPGEKGDTQVTIIAGGGK